MKTVTRMRSTASEALTPVLIEFFNARVSKRLRKREKGIEQIGFEATEAVDVFLHLTK